MSSELFPTAPSESAGELDEFGLRAAIGAEFKNSTLLLRAHYEEDNGINTSPRNSSLALKEFELSVADDGQQTTDASISSICRDNLPAEVLSTGRYLTLR